MLQHILDRIKRLRLEDDFIDMISTTSSRRLKLTETNLMIAPVFESIIDRGRPLIQRSYHILIGEIICSMR